MATAYAQILDSIPDMIGILMIGTAFYLVRRQRLSQFVDVRKLLLLVDAFFACVLFLDLLNRLYIATEFAVIDDLLQSLLILSDVSFLTAISYVIYVRPREKTFKNRVGALLTTRLWPHGIVLFSYMGYLLFAILYLIFDAPYTVSNLSTIGGVPVIGLEYNQGAEIVSIIILVIFVAYPSAETFMAARQIRNRFVGRNIQALGISWIVIGAELFIFNGYLINQGIDLREIGYLISAAAFSVSIVIFRRVSILEEFFVGIKEKKSEPAFSIANNPFSSRIVATPATTIGGKSSAISVPEKEGLKMSNLIGRNNAILLEVDPSMSYEELVRDFAIESSSNGYSVFAFIANGSPMHRILSTLPEVRMYVMSSSVSFPKPAAAENQRVNTILVPVYDAAITLDILDTLARNLTPEANAVMIFDNLSDLVLITGFESSFKFLKKAIEILNDSNLAVLFLLISGTLESRTLNTIRSLFARHLAFDSSGLKITR